MLLEPGVEARAVDVEGVGVLHGEFADPEHTRLGPGLVAELGVHLVPDLRQVPIRGQLHGGEGEDLLLGHAQDQFGALAILELEQVVPHQLVAARLPPDLGGVQCRRHHLLTADGVHLLADDAGHLETDSLAKGEHGVRARRQLPDEAAPD